MKKQWYLCLVLAVLCFTCTAAFYDWSHQQTLFVPNTRPTYGLTTPLLVGRGFQTLVTGYDPVSPGIFVHTTDDGFVQNSHVVWSQQKVLKPSEDLLATDLFGKIMVSFNQTLIVAAPNRANRRGGVYVFNGTKRHWSQIQRITAPETTEGDLFGDSMALHNDRLIIGAKGQSMNGGAAYVYERPSGGLYWSRTARLLPRDQRKDGYFAEKVSLYENTVAVSAHNDNPGDSFTSDDEFTYDTGSAYIFTGSTGTWSQQQKLVANEFLFYERGGAFREFLDVSLGSRILGPEIAVNQDSVALGVSNVNSNLPNRESLYIFRGSAATNSWSLQQKLLAKNDSTTDPYYQSTVMMDPFSTLIGTVMGKNSSASYIFKSFGSGWSLQQKLTAFNLTGVDLDDTSTYPDSIAQLDFPANFTAAEKRRELTTRFSNPALWGGHLIHNAGPIGGVQIRSQYRNGSCLRLWLSDHFLDGWDTALLTVRAPDLSNDTFHPHCDQVDPFLVRYCPYQPSEEGVYIIKVFDAIKARFFWEISWQVTIEATGETFQGDFSTKMEFRYNGATSSFSLETMQNEIDLEAACFRCTRYSFLSWTQLQISGNSAFWPLVVSGAPYYISDYEGRELVMSGKVCHGVTKYECYQTMTDGTYILRLGGGAFGRLTGFPYNDSHWRGCGEEGGVHDQLVFRISGGECHPLQKFRYKHRCDLPPPINVAAATDASGEIIPSPTFGGTVKPTQNVFGLGAAGGKNSFIRRQRGATFEADTSYDDVLQVAQVVEQDQDQNQEHERKEFFAAGDDAVLDDDQKNNNGGENQRQQLEGLGAGSDDAEEEDEEEKEEEGDEGDQPPLTGFELLSELLKSKRPSQAPTATPSQQAAGEGKGGTAAEEVAQQATQAAAALKHLHRTPMELAESIGDVDSVRAYRAARQRLEPQF